MSSPSSFPASFTGRGRAVPRPLLLAAALMFSLSAVAAADLVPDAPGVPPAPVIDRPLPPAVAPEIPEDQPSPEHAWVPGHWRWLEGSYVWVAAHWELPPVANAVWIPPQWQAQGNGYVLTEGRWEESSSGTPEAAETAATVVAEPPPPPNREIIVERPSPAHVWISGYWSWRAGRHLWVAGRWELPPRERAVWVQPRWERRGGGYVFVAGYWRDAVVAVSAPPPPPDVRPGPPPAVVVLRDPPPPPRHEWKSARPSPRHAWIDGYWALRGGRRVWIAGHWEVPPRGRTVWVAPHWDRRRDGYVFIDGYWR